MQRYRTSRIAMFAALGTLAALAAPAPAAPISFTVRGVSSASTPLLSVTDADQLLNGQIASKTDGTASIGMINFNEPDNHVGGLFPNDSAFPGTSPGHENNFAAEVTGHINIPTAGNYTFGVSSDDGFALQVGSFSAEHPGLRRPGETYATFDFAKAGTYAVDLVYFEHNANAELELFASPGKYTVYGEKGSNFQLVGDTTHGGLAVASGVSTPLPEPSGIVLMAPLAVGLLLRRRTHRSGAA